MTRVPVAHCLVSLLLLCACRATPEEAPEPSSEPDPLQGRISAPLGFERHGPAAVHAATPPATRVELERALARLDGDPVERQLRARAADDDRESLLQQLRSARVQGLVFEGEESLTRVVAAVSRATDLPLVVAPAAERAAQDAGVLFRLNLTHPVSAVGVLNLIDEQAGPDVRWTARHGVLLFTTQASAAEDAILRTYDLRSLTFGRTDFSGPRIDRLRLLDELEDDDGGGPFGGVGEVHVGTSEDELLDLVQEMVAPGTWADEGVSIEASNGFLFVRHTPEVQAQVRRLLQVLGA